MSLEASIRSGDEKHHCIDSNDEARQSETYRPLKHAATITSKFDLDSSLSLDTCRLQIVRRREWVGRGWEGRGIVQLRNETLPYPTRLHYSSLIYIYLRSTLKQNKLKHHSLPQARSAPYILSNQVSRKRFFALGPWPLLWIKPKTFPNQIRRFAYIIFNKTFRFIKFYHLRF